MRRKEKDILAGTPLGRHSMNQKVMKRVHDQEQGFYKSNHAARYANVDRKDHAANPSDNSAPWLDVVPEVWLKRYS